MKLAKHASKENTGQQQNSSKSLALVEMASAQDAIVGPTAIMTGSSPPAARPERAPSLKQSSDGYVEVTCG